MATSQRHYLVANHKLHEPSQFDHEQHKIQGLYREESCNLSMDHQEINVGEE